ncbi:MAG: hypothetical protein ACYC1Z_12130 [Georgenia sp.]
MAVITTEVDTEGVEGPRVWCTETRMSTRLIGGFCECCGARDHDWR